MKSQKLPRISKNREVVEYSGDRSYEERAAAARRSPRRTWMAMRWPEMCAPTKKSVQCLKLECCLFSTMSRHTCLPLELEWLTIVINGGPKHQERSEQAAGVHNWDSAWSSNTSTGTPQKTTGLSWHRCVEQENSSEPRKESSPGSSWRHQPCLQRISNLRFKLSILAATTTSPCHCRIGVQHKHLLRFAAYQDHLPLMQYVSQPPNSRPIASPSDGNTPLG